MTNPLFLKLDSIIANCEALIKEYQQVEQQVDISQRSILNLFRVKKWEVNYQILHANTSRIDTSLSQLELFYTTNKDKLSADTNLYVKEYIRYFSSVSYASNLRTKIQKNVIDDFNMVFKEKDKNEESKLETRREDLNKMTVALKECEKNAISVNKVVEKIRYNQQLKATNSPIQSKNDV